MDVTLQCTVYLMIPGDPRPFILKIRTIFSVMISFLQDGIDSWLKVGIKTEESGHIY